MSESEIPLKRECLLTASGSQEVNGSYSQTSEEDLFYKKKYTVGDPPGIVYIITLESLPELGEDFEVAWALQSHDTDTDEVVTFYATPCDEPEATGFPLKGWVTVSGVEPVPRIFPRPVQRPRDRTSTLDIIEENLEQDFPIEPYWADEISREASEDVNWNIFNGWDTFGGDEDEDYGEYDDKSSEGEDSDYGEVELPDDIMENFKDGTFVHKLNQEDNAPAYEQPVAISPRGAGCEVDSDTSEDVTIVRHEANRDTLQDQSNIPSMPLLISSQGDEKDEIKKQQEERDEYFEVKSRRRVEYEICPENHTADETEAAPVNLMSPYLAYARSLGKKDDITIVDLRTEPPSITAAPIPPGARFGSKVIRHARVGSGQQDDLDFRVISPPYRPLIAPLKDPFISSITVNSRSRTGRDHVDIDLISAVGPPEVMKSPLKNEYSRHKSQRKRQGKRSQNVEIKTIDSEVDVEETADIVTSEHNPVGISEVKTDVEVSRPTEKERYPERDILEEEMHQLKTKMRKCDRLSKLRKRGHNLTKDQQETLVHKSKYQKRIEELRRLLGSDIGKS
jgi:hypothetical protein